MCRFFAGVGGSGGLAVFGGVLADIWDLKERAKASALMSTLLYVHVFLLNTNTGIRPNFPQNFRACGWPCLWWLDI